MTSPSQTRRYRADAAPVARAGGWTAAKVLAQGFEFGAWVVLARSLDPSAVGQLAVGVLVVRYFGIVADWGAQHIGARIVVEDGGRSHPDELKATTTLVHHRNLLCLAAGAAFLACCWLLGLQRFWPLVALLLFRGINRDWVALGQGRHLASAVPSLMFGMGVLASSTVVTSASDGARWFGLAALVALVVSIGLNQVGQTIDRRDASLGSGGVDRSRIVSRGAWVTAMTLADQLLATADVGLLGALDSSDAAGVYSTVYRLPNSLLLVAGLATAAAVPTLRSSDTSNLEPAGLLHRACRIGFGLALGVVVAGFALTAAVEPVFGPAYLQGRSALAILFAATAAVAFTVPLRAILLAWDSEPGLAKLFIVAAAANLGGNLVLIPIFGMVGAALATLGVQLVLGVALWRRAVVVLARSAR